MNYIVPQRPYIDIHNHLGRTVNRAPTVGQNAAMCLARFSQTNVVAALTMPTAIGSPIANGRADIRSHNETVARACRDFPSVFPIGLALSEVRFGHVAMDDLDRAISELGLVGYVDHPPFNLSSLPLIEVAASRNGLCNLHCHTDLMEKIARMFPSATFITHANAYAVANLRGLDNMIFEVLQYPDGRGTVWDFQKIADAVGADRVFYGGDLPYYDYRFMQTKLETAKISEDLKDRIAWRNALGLIQRFRPSWQLPSKPPSPPRIHEPLHLWGVEPDMEDRLTVDIGDP
jgi:hypothetical protein